MALVSLKKLLTGAAIVTGGGYGGALIYGSRDEEGRATLGELLPGYTKTYDSLQRLRVFFNFARTKFQSVVSTNDSSRVTQSRRGLHEPREPALTRAEGLAAAATDDRLFEQRVEENYQRKFEKEVETLKLRQSAIFEHELQMAVEQEHSRNLLKIAALNSRADSLDSRINHIYERFLSSERASKAWLDFECALALFSSSKLSNSLTDAVKRTLELVQISNPCIELCGIYHSVLKSAQSSSSEELSVDYFTREYDSLLPWAESYAYLNQEVSLISFLIASLGFSSILSRRPAEKYTRAVLYQARASLQRGDLRQALNYVNQLAGWPRVLLKDWIKNCRHYLEIQQGLGVIKFHMLATRLCSQN